MPIIQSCCCWRSLRRGCYAAAAYTLMYYSVTIVTMGHFIEMEQRYLSGALVEPESESFLEPDKITPMTVSLNITLLACSILGFSACIMLIIGVYKDIKYLLVPWIFTMSLETLVEVINVIYLLYLQTVKPPMRTLTKEEFEKLNEYVTSETITIDYEEFKKMAELEENMNFNPITSFLFTMDFFIIILNLYALVCVISQYQEYLAGRGTAAFDYSDRQLADVQYTATVQHTTTTSSAPSGRRRSAPRPMPSRIDPEEFSEAPTKIITSVLAKPSRSNVKKHVQFPDEQSCIEEGIEPPAASCVEEEEEKPESRMISSLWMELETEVPPPDR